MRLGKTAVFGAVKEEGIFINTFEATPSFEKLEQPDENNEVQGVLYHRFSMDITMTGEVPQENAKEFAMGSTVTFANLIPADRYPGGEMPAGTTTVVEGNPYSRARDAFQELNITAKQYLFATSA